ncbi:MAG: hypothetical protein R3Y63_16005 [Eubacteriales bacterium]
MGKKHFYPSYSEVNGDKIFESADRPLTTRESGYYADLNCKVHFYYGSIQITDLSNAMKTGKECSQKVFSADKNYNNFDDMQNDLLEMGIETLPDLLNATELEGYTCHEYSPKGVHTFSPFVEVKPIKEPSKWTASHLAKAILSGQVFHAVSEGRFSDDYARDAEQNFGRGRPVHLEEVARSLIEDGKSGLWFQHEQKEDGTTEISLATHSFDYKKFYFDVNCNHELKQERLEGMAKTLEEVNAEVLSQNKQIDLTQINDQEIYQVKYLEQNTNTQLYEGKSRMMYPEQLRDLAEFDFEIVEITAIEIQEETLYQVGTLQNPVSDQDKADGRFIGCIGGKTVVTGFALKELLMEERQFSVLNVSHPDNIPALKEQMEQAQGGKTWCFSDRGEFDAVGNLERLEAEEQRMEDGLEFDGMRGMT